MPINHFVSFELTPVNLNDQIVLSEKYGLVVLRKTEDGKTILVVSGDYAPLPEDQPTPVTITNVDAALGLVLDIGIQREKMLTAGGGFYAPHAVAPPVQSNRLVTQADFDEKLLESIKSTLDRRYQSGNSTMESAALKASYLVDAYNDARLLFPRFHNESYLGLIRIIDAIYGSWGGDEFALASAEVSPILNSDIFQKISQVKAFGERLDLAKTVFKKQLDSVKPAAVAARMQKLDDAGRLVFACCYSAYRYRNAFVHRGFPFPDTVKESFGLDSNSGMAFLNPVVGLLYARRLSPTGSPRSDANYIDIHQVLGDPAEVSEFRDKLFKLIPTWHFIKSIAREALLNHIKAL
jgi:hypothetical protein